jgi:esterase/lipase superfamily enzyme
MPDAAVPVFSTRQSDKVPHTGSGMRDVALVTRGAATRGAGTGSGTRICTLWFGTNRQIRITRSGKHAFSNHRDQQLHVGRCEVLIPKSHKFGSVGSSWWTRLWNGDDRLSVETIELLERAAYWIEMTKALDAISSRSAVVFIHGFWTTFEGAAIRAAQIGCDLNIPGLMAFFSWPSRGTFGGYVNDIDAVEAAAPRLIEFLQGIAAIKGIERIHLIAHSMGNRGLLTAMHDLFATAPPPTTPMFGHIVLAAADVDAEIFKNRSGAFSKAARRTTLYTSNHDLALLSSGLIRDHTTRAGFFPPLTIVDGIDTIQVSDVDLSWLGHGYVAEAAPILSDMHELLVNDLPPERRVRLRHIASPPHWEFAP